MDCKLVEDLISQYIEGDVSQETHEQITLHLEKCSGCRDLKEKIEEMLYSFPDLEEDVPFFLKNRLLYIPESQETEVITEKRFYFMKWVAAAIGTFVLFLNLFYFTNFYPPANRLLHTVVAKVKTFTVDTGAYIERLKESKAFSFLSVFKSKKNDKEDHDNNKESENRDSEDKKRSDPGDPVEDHLKKIPDKTGKQPVKQDKKSGDDMKKKVSNNNSNLNDGGQND